MFEIRISTLDRSVCNIACKTLERACYLCVELTLDDSDLICSVFDGYGALLETYQDGKKV